eukprot:COSAG01_NODE_1849_length_9064_cov_212.400446_4_plen_530_part_00
MSFWQSDSRTPYGQTSLSIVAENGKQFTQNSKVVIVVQPDVSFFQPSESYLSLRVRVDHPPTLPTKLQLDSIMGGQSLIRNIRILTGTGTLIEEIQDYNLLANIITSYDTDDNIKNKRSLTEGSTIHNPSCAINAIETFNSPFNSANHNPYFSSPSNGQSEQQWVRLQLPLHTGIFRSKKIFPVIMTSGLRIEIMLEEAKKIIKNLATTVISQQVPRLGTAIAKDDAGKAAFVDLATSNHITTVESCPFKVGEEIEVVDADGTTNPESPGEITGIAIHTGKVRLTFAAEKTYTNDHAVHTSLVRSKATTGAAFNATYTVDEVELVLQKIQVPPNNVNAMMKAMKEQGVMTYDFLTFQNYKFSQLAGITQSTMNLNLNNSEIKSILSVAVDTSPKTGKELVHHHLQHGFVGVADNISNYQWMYGGILNPDRKVDMEKLSAGKIEQQHLIELEKALVVAGIPAKSFRRYHHQIVIGRALALQKGSYDGRGKDFNLQVAYEGTAPAINKLWNNFVAHVRKIEMTSNGINVVF